VIGIVHGAADYLPDLLDYMADHYPTLTAQVGSLTGRATQTISLKEYRDEVILDIRLPHVMLKVN